MQCKNGGKEVQWKGRKEKEGASYRLSGAETEAGGRGRHHGDVAVIGVIGVGRRGRAVSRGRPE